MKQRIAIAKIGGEAGAAVISLCRAWTAARTADDPTEWAPEQWSASVRREMDRFAGELRLHAAEPPVLFFSEHVDMWSGFNVFDEWLSPAGGSHPVRLCSSRIELWCYALPDGGLLSDHLQRSIRRKRIRERHPQEERWVTMNLREATLAWEGIVDSAAIVLLREVLGPLIEDHEIEESLARIPEWIGKRKQDFKDERG